MIDSSVWIANIRKQDGRAVHRLETLMSIAPEMIVVGDLILLEVLQGARDDVHARRLERDLRRFRVHPLLGGDMATRAARNYRTLRAKGVTIRKLADIVIGTFCIERGYALLHQDPDFTPMAAHLGLMIA